MIGRTFLLCCLLAACAAQQQQPADASQGQAGAPAQLQTQSSPLQPFNTINVCIPVNILVQPNATADAYTITLEAEPSVLSALSYNVVNPPGGPPGQGGTLQLESAGNFTTTRPIKVVVSMPAAALQAINHQGTGAEVYVAPGFTVNSFTATTAFGAGRLFVNQMAAQAVALQTSGTGDVVLTGSFGTVNASSTGTGALYISGVNDTVTLNLQGVSNAFVQPGQPTATITGVAQGINTVQYTDGTCRMQSSFPFIQICQSVPFINVPAPNGVWTCGLAVNGAFTCNNQGTAYTSANGFVGESGAPGSTPITTQAPAGVSAFTPSSFQFAGASPAGPGTGVQQQAGAVTPGGTTASSNVAGTGSVSASSVAGPSGAQTSTTQGGQTTSFGTTGQQTTGGTTGGGGTVVGTPGAAGAGTGSAQQAPPQATMTGSATTGATASASSTAFATASPAAATSTAVSGPQGTVQQTSGQSGVARVSPQGQATAQSQACQATVAELRIPVGGVQA